MKPFAIDLFQAYLIRCLITGRCYVGITSRTIKQRWSEHLYDARQGVKGMAISRAIAKHGAENFQIELLCCSRSWADICATETTLIAQWETRAPRIAAARTGTVRSEDTKAKIAVYWAKRRAAGEFKTTKPYAHGSKSLCRSVVT